MFYTGTLPSSIPTYAFARHFLPHNDWSFQSWIALQVCFNTGRIETGQMPCEHSSHCTAVILLCSYSWTLLQRATDTCLSATDTCILVVCHILYVPYTPDPKLRPHIGKIFLMHPLLNCSKNSQNHDSHWVKKVARMTRDLLSNSTMVRDVSSNHEESKCMCCSMMPNKDKDCLICVSQPKPQD